MDIIMPQLDGVSATAWIREIQNRVPVVAMTSNIRQEDIDTYYQYGELDPSQYHVPDRPRAFFISAVIKLQQDVQLTPSPSPQE